MKVLLTGGAGFLGSHISNKLIENNHHVTVLDDPKQRKPDISKAIELLEWQPEIELLEGIRKTVDYFKSVV